MRALQTRGGLEIAAVHRRVTHSAGRAADIDPEEFNPIRQEFKLIWQKSNNMKAQRQPAAEAGTHR
jgi:hypothetical protein